MNVRRLIVPSLCAIFALACGDDDGGTDAFVPPADSAIDTVVPPDGAPPDSPPVDGAPDAPVADAGPTNPWTITSHPCSGNRTDTLWRDDDGTLYVGCGSTTEGLGLFVSTDEGATWGAPTTTPLNALDTWRVLDVSRSSDDLLYIAGVDTGSSRRVLSADTSSANWVLAEVYNAGTIVGTAFTVGTFRRDSTGRAFAESLNGVDIQMRASDAAEWVDASTWGGAPRRQILDLEIFDDQVFGCGSTISEPPQFYAEDTAAVAFTMDTTVLAEGIAAYDGEMWSIDVDASGAILGGANQDADAGFIYTVTLGETPEVTSYDLRTLFPDDPTWIRGVCKDGDTLVAVGEQSVRNLGIVLMSTDGGTTWTDETPVGDSPFRPVHECVVSDTKIYIAGSAGGFLVRNR